VGRERMYRLLAAGLVMNIPGETLAEKAKALQEKKMPAWILSAAIKRINEALGLDANEVAQRVETFQSV
jgi:hypothetical protein